jgi:hypothetical protein
MALTCLWRPGVDGDTKAKIIDFVIAVTTDGDREYAYDRDSHVGQLARGLGEGPKRGWTIASMKADWKTIDPD